MKNNVSGTIAKQWRRYPKSVFVDLQIATYAALFGIIAMAFDRQFTGIALPIGLIFLVVAYLILNARNLFVGERLSHQFDVIRRVRFRFVKGANYRVTAVFTMPTIVTPNRDLSLSEQVVHEIGHVRSGDHRFYAIIKPVMIMCLMAMFISLVTVIVKTPWCFSCVDDDIIWLVMGVIAYKAAIMLGLTFFVAYALFLTVREREYLADRFAYDVMGDCYRSFLEDEAAWARKPKSWWIGLWNSFTHPSYEDRYKNLKKGRFLLSEASVLSGALAVSNFYFLQLNDRLFFKGLFEVDVDGGIEGNVFALAVIATSMMYVSSAIAFTVDNNSFWGAILKLLSMLFGVFIVVALFEFDLVEYVNPINNSLFGSRLQDAMSLFFSYFGAIFALWFLSKKCIGYVNDFTVWGNLVMVLVVGFGLYWLNIIGSPTP